MEFKYVLVHEGCLKFSLYMPRRNIGYRVEVQLHTFLTFPLDGGRWLT